MLASFVSAYGVDVAALLFHVGCFVTYRVVQRGRARRDPSATLQDHQAVLRAEWVADILRSGNGLLGVQTLRNATMVTLFFASNTVFLIFGVLTLASQGALAKTFGLLDPGKASPEASQLKLLLLLLTLLMAFFCFISAVRLFSHASVSIGVKTAVPEFVARRIDDAWHYQALGVRGYYFAAPILFWLFGTPWLVLADLGALGLMYAIDNVSPRD